MLANLKREYSFFCSNPLPMRTLLLTNLIFSMVLPIIELFTGAYIIRNSADFSLVMVFQLAQGTGIPVGFILNWFMLAKVPVKRLYSLGMMMSGLAMASMMLQTEPGLAGVSLAGLLMGVSYGFFWANRTTLALSATQNTNRNYFYGMETFFYTFAVIVMPMLAGWFIAASHSWAWFGNNVNGAYYVLTGLVFILTIVASTLLQRGDYRNLPKARLKFRGFHRLWQKMLRMAVLKGLAQGYITTAPVMLIMKLVGKEGELGTIQSTGAILSAGMLYLLGRKTSPQHRLKVYALGLGLFWIGAFTNMVAYSAAGVIVFVGCLVFARPLMDLAYFPIQLGVIEYVSKKEKHSAFNYIFTHELGLYVGRVFGCGLFILIARFVSEDFALRYVLAFITTLQLSSLYVARTIMGDRAWQESATEDLKSVEMLKKPVAV